jgi:DNA polymerase III subunit epsilon
MNNSTSVDIEFTKRPIAITDCEMTGLYPHKGHELIEIGLVLVNQPQLEIIDTLEVRIRPEHLELADPQGMKVNGYTEELWKDAVPLKTAMEQYAVKTCDAIFSGYNICVDWAFIDEGFRKAGISHSMDYHMIDIPSIAWAKLRINDVKKVRLRALCELLGVEPEPDVHRAINGAMTAYQVLKKLLEMK